MERFVKYEKGDVIIFQFPFSDIGDFCYKTGKIKEVQNKLIEIFTR